MTGAGWIWYAKYLGNRKADVEQAAALPGRTRPTLPTTGLCWSPDGKRLATSSDDGTVKIWDSSTGQLAISLSTGKSVASVKWHPGGKRIVSGTRDGRLQIWDATQGFPRDQAE